MEEFLSQNGIPYTLRNQFTDPLTPDEVFALWHDDKGRQIGPLIKVGNYVDPRAGYGIVYGGDLIRLEERLEIRPGAKEDGCVVWGRPTDTGTQRVLEFCRERHIPVQLVHLDVHPLTRDELWDLLYFPESGILQSPLTVVDGQVVLGYDLEWLRAAMGPAGAQLKDVPTERRFVSRRRPPPV